MDITTAAQSLDAQEDLITRLIARDESALHSLYQMTVGKIYGLALRVTQDAGLAEEVTEDCYWQVWQEIDRFNQHRSPLLSWMLMICRSRAIDALRKRKPAEMTALSLDMIADSWSDEAPGPQQQLEQMQQIAVVRTALLQLSPIQQQILYQAFYQGLTQQEIAEAMQMPLGTVKSHIRRAQLILKDSLDGENTL